MSKLEQMCNKVEKVSSPAFVTTLVTSQPTQRIIFKTWSSLMDGHKKSQERTTILTTELDLLKGYIERKGTQLRLEKALLLTKRIYKLGSRWCTNKFLHEFNLFNDGVQQSLEGLGRKKSSKGKAKRTTMTISKKKSGNTSEQNDIVRLPSRQWANWIIYLILRETLILAKIKFECERTVNYWLGLISSSHHATDSLVAVGILSRTWYVSSAIVQDFCEVIFPTVCKLTTHLEPTKAENWLTDFETPENLSGWLEKILGSPFIPARLRGLEELGKSRSKKAKMDTVLSEVFKSETIHKGRSKREKEDSRVPLVTGMSKTDDEEDIGVPVGLSDSKILSKKAGKTIKTKPTETSKLNEHWTLFFKNYKTKLKQEKGRKQFLVRIRKYQQNESDKQIVKRLQLFRKVIKVGDYVKIVSEIESLRKMLTKKLKQYK